MSGGHFDYQQYKIRDIADSIEDYVYGHELDDEQVDAAINDRWMEDEEKEYIKTHKHSIPNRYGFADDTIEKFKEGIKILRTAEIYAQRIDWLLSFDDGEEEFHKRLEEDLNKLKENERQGN